uniref:Uncharacterized protein n=1 Tax=Rhabditophanes sp. KR3021 TaxID=114890 RepID=A0AC35U2N0_9BILA
MVFKMFHTFLLNQIQNFIPQLKNDENIMQQTTLNSQLDGYQSMSFPVAVPMTNTMGNVQSISDPPRIVDLLSIKNIWKQVLIITSSSMKTNGVFAMPYTPAQTITDFGFCLLSSVQTIFDFETFENLFFNS